MNRNIILMCMIIFNESVTSALCGVELTAVHESLYAAQLYLEVWNGNHPRVQSDPAAKDPNIRKLICQNVTGSDFFVHRQYSPVDVDDVENIEELEKRELWNVLDHIYDRKNFINRSSALIDYYLNPFKRVDFLLNGYAEKRYETNIPVEEWAFLCVVWNQHKDIFMSYYVSKEYDVMINDSGIDLNCLPMHIAGRFVWEQSNSRKKRKAQPVMLAEEPARAYTIIDHNIEHYYLELRRRFRPTQQERSDPICKLMSQDHGQTYNQHTRLCTSVFGSLYFKGKLSSNPKDGYEKDCLYREVSFQTYSARKLSQGKRFREWMAYCKVMSTDHNKETGYYISRAYNSNHIFVYRISKLFVYLENISTHVSILDRP